MDACSALDPIESSRLRVEQKMTYQLYVNFWTLNFFNLPTYNRNTPECNFLNLPTYNRNPPVLKKGLLEKYKCNPFNTVLKKKNVNKKQIIQTNLNTRTQVSQIIEMKARFEKSNGRLEESRKQCWRYYASIVFPNFWNGTISPQSETFQ